jgi:hypothetical protein
MNFKLNNAKLNYFSQFGEDGIIERIFEILPVNENRWCVEFGAWDGIHLSNTHHLISQKNWQAVLIEGDKKRFKQLTKNYLNNTKTTLVNQFVSFQGKHTLDNILKETRIPVDFDLLSIDIDGNDYHIWESLIYYSPEVVIIEFNPTIPNDIEFIQERNLSIQHGSSLLSIIKLGKRKGYELIATTKCNAFFVKKTHYELFNIKNNSIECMWKEFKTTRIYQLYDGTLVADNEFILHWKNKKVSKFDIQVIPKYIKGLRKTRNLIKSLFKIK